MRTRDLRPGFFEDDVLTAQEPWVRLLFAGLWGLADPRGVLKYNIKSIDAAIFPNDTLPVQNGLQLLHNLGFIHIYEAEGMPLIWVVNFEKHQRPHPKEPRNDYPLPTICEGAAKPLPDHGSAVEKENLNHGFRTYKKIQKEKKEKKYQEGESERKPKPEAARYAEPDRRGNPRTPEPDYPNIHLSEAERLRVRERFAERGLRAEFFIDAYQELNTSLGRGRNLRDSVEHYSSLTGWALRFALKNQSDTDRANRAAMVSQSPLPGAPAETNFERNKRVLDEFRNRNSGNSRNHAGDISELPIHAGHGAGMVPLVRTSSVPGDSFSARPLHQNARHEVCAKCERGVPGPARNQSRACSEVHREQDGKTRQPGSSPEAVCGSAQESAHALHPDNFRIFQSVSQAATERRSRLGAYFPDSRRSAANRPHGQTRD